MLQENNTHHHLTTFSVISLDLHEPLSIILFFPFFLLFTSCPSHSPFISVWFISLLLLSHRFSSRHFVSSVCLSDSVLSSICGFYSIICSFISCPSSIRLLAPSVLIIHPFSTCLSVHLTCHSCHIAVIPLFITTSVFYPFHITVDSFTDFTGILVMLAAVCLCGCQLHDRSH